MIEEAVKLVDVDYFLGRCCFILSKGKHNLTQLYTPHKQTPFSINLIVTFLAKQEHLHSVDLNEVTDLVEAYDSTMFCGDLTVRGNLINKYPSLIERFSKRMRCIPKTKNCIVHLL